MIINRVLSSLGVPAAGAHLDEDATTCVRGSRGDDLLVGRPALDDPEGALRQDGYRRLRRDLTG